MRPARLASALALVLGATSARAQQATEPMVRLEVDAPPAPDCPALAALSAEVTRRMGRAPFADDAPRTLTVRYRRHNSRWGARIRARGADGTASRELTPNAATCAETLDAVALAVALAIDPDAPVVTTPPAPTPTPPVCPACPTCAACPAPVVCPAPTVCPTPPPPPPRRVPASLSVRGGLALGATPTNGSLSLQWRSGRVGLLHATAGVSWSPEVRTDDGAAGFGYTALFLGPCVGSRGEALRGALCAGLQGGAVHAFARNFIAVSPGDYLWLGAFIEGAGRLRVLSPVFVELSARAAVALYQSRFVIQGRGDAWRPWPVALDISLGVGIDL